MPRMTPAPAAIRPLSDHLVDQIAAGEVIERPASVVKELVENSLDAGATRVDVEIADGGIELITVSDDGSGIAAGDLAGALRRHWTSKLSRAEQLDGILSLGFRGEALASITAVADFAMVTRADSEPHAWRIEARAGDDAAAPRPAQGNRGTRIEVRRLFHRLPARRRFLKQPRTEYLHVYRLMRQFAFARPDVAFGFVQAGARGLRLQPAARGEDAPRWRSIFGKAFCADARVVDLARDGMTVRGWVGTPALATNQADTQFICVNGRVIRDRHLNHAVRLAFGDAIAPGRFPGYALAIELAADALDVNVHPGKLEVRFADLRTVHDLLHAAVREVLGAASGAAVREARGAPATAPRNAAGANLRDRPGAYATAAARPQPASGAQAFGRPLALVADRYLLSAADDGVVVHDLRAAWQAVIERRLRAPGDARPLLLPLRLSPAAWSALAPRASALQGLGFGFDDLGAGGQVLRAVPLVLPTLDPAALIDALVASHEREAGAAVAEAAAGAIDLGRHGQATRAALEALAAAATAAGVACDAFSVPLEGAALDGLFAPGTRPVD